MKAIFIDERMKYQMARYRIVRTDFWKNPFINEQLNGDEKYFYLYLLTNPNTTQIRIYKIMKKQMAYDMCYSLESIHSLVERFSEEYQLIRYNPETRELAIRDWWKHNLQKGGKPVMDCIYSELKEVQDLSLIRYVSETITKPDIYSLYEFFYNQADRDSIDEVSVENETDTYVELICEEAVDTFTCRDTLREQNKKKKKEKEKQQQQKAFTPDMEKNSQIEPPHVTKESGDVKEIIEFWDSNGFGLTNVNGKEQLLAWLDDSRFLQPKEIILKAMTIACANNKRKLNYVVGILKNWENESLLTVEEIDSYVDDQKPVVKQKQVSGLLPAGRDIPSGFVLDLTAGEK